MSTRASIKARLEVIEAFLRGELSREEARLRIESIKAARGWREKTPGEDTLFLSLAATFECCLP